MYNEAGGETIGAMDTVGWTARNRAFQRMKQAYDTEGKLVDCTSYVGGMNWHDTCADLPCNEANPPEVCTTNNSKWYCCALHGAQTKIGTSGYQFIDEHVSFSELYKSGGGFLEEAVLIMSNFIPEISSGYQPEGTSYCAMACGETTNFDTGSICARQDNPPFAVFNKAAPQGPMEFLSYDYCAKTAAGTLDQCKWYAGDICGNTDSTVPPNGNPIEVPPHSACPPPNTPPRGSKDLFFWNRQP